MGVRPALSQTRAHCKGVAGAEIDPRNLAAALAASLMPTRSPSAGALSGSAAVALETRQLIAEQKHLFEAFIQVIAAPIDAKRLPTGGHCARVPEIAKLLAAAACEGADGPFAGFQLDANG